MAEKQLYPVFEVPDFVTKKNEESRKQQYKPSVYFDYVTGDFRLDGADAWREPAAAKPICNGA